MAVPAPTLASAAKTAPKMLATTAATGVSFAISMKMHDILR
jgi:hypothetical protein